MPYHVDQIEEVLRSAANEGRIEESRVLEATNAFREAEQSLNNQPGPSEDSVEQWNQRMNEATSEYNRRVREVVDLWKSAEVGS